MFRPVGKQAEELLPLAIEILHEIRADVKDISVIKQSGGDGIVMDFLVVDEEDAADAGDILPVINVEKDPGGEGKGDFKAVVEVRMGHIVVGADVVLYLNILLIEFLDNYSGVHDKTSCS